MKAVGPPAMRGRKSFGNSDAPRPRGGVSDRCETRAMTQDDINNGRLVCVIGIAPVTPAEL